MKPIQSNNNKPLGKDLPILRKARGLWATNKRSEALPLFEKAVAQNPRNSRVLIDAARALGASHEVPRAEELLEKAARISGSHREAAPLIAQTFRMIYRPERAVAAFEAIRDAGSSKSANIGFELALLYERANRIDEAIAAVECCLKLEPSYPEPKLVLARLQRRNGNTDAATHILKRLTSAGTSVPAETRARAFAELAEMHDSEGEYDAAIASIEECKSLQRSSKKAENLSKRSIVNNEILKQVYTELSPKVIDDWQHQLQHLTLSGCMGVGHILGFPRSGTTLLEQMLDAHPQVISSQERPVFARDVFSAMFRINGDEPLTMESLQAIPTEHLATQRRRYLDLMQNVLGEPLAGRFHLDKNPNHTSLAVGLYRLFPESRFIVALRDPRDVLVSCYLRFFTLTEFSANFLTWGGTSLIYQFEMGVWLVLRKLFSQSNNWIEVRYEDTVAAAQNEAKRVLEFLGMDWDDSVANYRSTLERKTVSSPTHAEVRLPVYSKAVGRWKHYERHIAPYLKGIDPFVKAFGYD